VIAAGKPVVSELDLAAAITDAPVVAVTGTNGKTTVCRLAERIGRAAGLETYACGNLETKFLTAAHEHPRADAFVVEASSFSLALCQTFDPRVAVVTSLAPDHLDWHGTFEHYRASKARIAARQRPGELFLYPHAQAELRDFAPADGPEIVPFASGRLDRGAWTEGDEIAVEFDAVSVRAHGVSALSKRGEHFAANAAAAAAAMAFLGVTGDAITDGLEGFVPDPHRLERVGSLNGVDFVDDSAATNAEATLAALRSFDRPVVLIAGGRNKGIDLAPLAAEATRLRAVVAIGEATGDLKRIFDPTSVFVSIAGSMREAVRMATSHARPGDVVLLSPACASHDMYTNYIERGEDFVTACREAGAA
jgi:UDP-N-acetylmuramoylalanine--D-glutamate ligase